MNVDVAIVGGGPAGSTTASFLRKYAPELKVALFEREKFPREHIGESQLPPIGKVLNEMGAWDKVEGAGFPIKIGVTFRWGNNDKLWDFELMPPREFKPEPRPGPYNVQRERIALQVERAIYDDILLKHAAELGTEVFESTKVAKVNHENDRISSIVLENGEEVVAKHYVDCSGNAATLRRALGIKVDAPTKLQNVAFWDYWDNAEWAFQFPGGATRVLILSIGAGWIWYIPVGLTRTSIGFVCPAEYYKKCGKSPAELYQWALDQEPLISELTSKATREGEVRGTKDWSFLTERLTGENWMLVGECAGFADPILSAGMTLAQTGAREAAYTIIALERGEHDPQWLKDNYQETQKRRISQHIRFADFWYSANGIFTDLEEYTRAIARDAGLELDAKKAFRWIGTGGFSDDILGQVGIGGLDLAGARQVSQHMLDADFEWQLADNNVLRLDVEGAEERDIPVYIDGKIEKARCFFRGYKKLPLVGVYKIAFDALEKSRNIEEILQHMARQITGRGQADLENLGMKQAIQVLEVMLGEGWIRGKLEPGKPRLNITTPRQGAQVHDSDLNERIEKISFTK